MNAPFQLAEKLENRLLFDGVPFVPVPMDPSLGLTEEVHAEVSFLQSVQKSIQNEQAGTAAISSQIGMDLSLLSANPGSRNEIVIIDSQVEGYEPLAELLQANGYNVNIIHATENGFLRLRAIVNSHSNIDALHIFANGSNARLDLGKDSMNGSLAANSNDAILRSITGRFSSDADILIYSSSLASDVNGASLVKGISSLTSTDVLASTTPTGNGLFGGNWDLEFAVGSIETNVIRIGGYEGLLSVPTLNMDYLSAVPNTKQVINVIANDIDPHNVSNPFVVGEGQLEVSGIYDSRNPSVRLDFGVGTSLTLLTGTILTNLGDGNIEVTLSHGYQMEERISYETSYLGRTEKSTLVIQRDTDGDGVIDLHDVDDDNDGILDEVEGRPFILPGTIGVVDKLEGTTALYSTFSEFDTSTNIRWSYVSVTDPFNGAVTKLSDPLNFQINAFAYNDQTDTFFAMVNSYGDFNGIAVQRGDILEIDRNGELFFAARPTRFTSAFHPDNPGGGARSGVFLNGVMYIMPNNASGVTQLYSVDVATGATQSYSINSGGGLGYHVADLVEINGSLYGVGRNYRATSELATDVRQSPFYLTKVEINGLNADFINKQFFGVPHITPSTTASVNLLQNYNFDAQWAVRNTDGSYSILFSSVTDRDLYRIDNYLDDIPVAYLVADGNQRTDTYDGANSSFSEMYSDSDKDGIPDHLDIDSDNDGIPDNIEAQATASYRAPTGIVNEFGLDLAYVDTNGISPVDTDKDGIADYLDTDSDDDGILDIAERGDGRAVNLPSILTDSDFDGLLDVFESQSIHGGINPTNNTSPNSEFYLADTRLLQDGSNAVPLLLDLNFRKVNAPPTGGDKVIAVHEDQSYSLGLSDFGYADSTESIPHNFSRVEIVDIIGQADLHYDGLLVAPGTVFSVAEIASGKLVWKPRDNVNGAQAAELVFHVHDDGGTRNGGVDRSIAPNTLSLSVAAVDDPPVSTDLYIRIDEDKTYRGTLPNVLDIDSSDLNYALHGDQPKNGTVAVLADGSFVYTPKADFHGSDYFEFSVSDGTNTIHHRVNIAVQPVVDAFDDYASIPWNTAIELDILKNDLFTGGTQSIELTDNGSWVFASQTPSGNLGSFASSLPGRYSFAASSSNHLLGTVFASDSNRLVEQIRFSWTIDETSALLSNQVTVGGVVTDSSGRTLLGSWRTEPNSATQLGYSSIAVDQTGIGIQYDFIFDLAVPIAANEVLLHVALEHSLTSGSPIVTTLNNVAFTPTNSTSVQIVEIEGQPIQVGGKVSVDNGEVTLNRNGNIVFTPEKGFHGTVSFSYSALSGGNRESAMVFVDVIPVPRAANDHYVVTEDSVSADVLLNDNFYGRPAQPIDLVQHPLHGQLLWQGDGKFTYTPDLGFVGVDTFVYQLRDGGAQATVYLTVGFGKDSFTDLSKDALQSPFDLQARVFSSSWGNSDRAWIYHDRGTVLREDPILAGYALPGTILVGRIYDSYGTLLSESTSQANASGNWTLQFWNIPSGINSRVIVEQIVNDTVLSSSHNDFKVTQDLYRSSQSEARYDGDGLYRSDASHGVLFSRLPSSMLQRLHDQNLNPLKLL